MVDRVERRGSWVFSSTIEDVPKDGQYHVSCAAKCCENGTEFDDDGEVLLHVCSLQNSGNSRRKVAKLRKCSDHDMLSTIFPRDIPLRKNGR